MKDWFSGKRVALVGNAASLFDKKYGTEIDNHEVVVRLNKAAMLFTRMDVSRSHGSITTHWLFFSTAEYKHKFGNIPQNIKKAHMSGHRQTAAHRKEVDFMLPVDELELLKDKLGHKNPTTGLMSIFWIAKSMPKQLDVYGFDWKETPTFTDMERKKDPMCNHDFEKERELCFREWFSQPHIRWRN